MIHKPTINEMEELRQDMMLENWCDEQCEIKMRNDDDFFYDYLDDRYGDLVQDFHDVCKLYDRDFNDWFLNMLEK